MDVYTETGRRRVFAGAIEWPGWCRAARGEDDALRALIGYGPRYAVALAGSKPKFRPPASVSDLHIVDRLRGNATTDFGAPSAAPTADLRDVDTSDLARLRASLRSSWAAFDRAVQAAEGRPLATGPRGGGRAVQAIVAHVSEAEASYLARLGTRSSKAKASDPRAAATGARTEFVDALTRAVKDGQPQQGPRGGLIWPPRYLVRRTAWHALDHAWEIEDRAGAGPARL